ncbi:CBS domain-containing protein [Nesterenkonia halotolerans]|uniref:CBS domain-containing protein n=1 Tax=Nesterenkonia halotolerans TaxID=225325 RepID=A0ABR9J6D5_9MICC|nr:CBS domain-containing protein [Nesterenkonia halotolerans]MBE1514409.1 CBS domain-containing protein [Nesterenkonia halotolerans]
MHTIDELMDSTPMRLRMDSPLTEAAHELARTSTEALPLCDPHGYFLGVLTHAGLKHALGSMGDLAYSLRAQHLMTTTTPVVSTDHTVDEALSLMATHQIEYLPVVEEGVLQGMLTSRAIAAADAPTTIAELPETGTDPSLTLDRPSLSSRSVSRVDLEAA